MHHKLSLEIPETLAECQIRIKDTSIYADGITPSCPKLDITVAGFNHPTVFTEPTISTYFDSAFTACSLGLQREGCNDRMDILPDGIYIVKYSVSPNDYVFVEYNHLRRTKALNMYNKELCEFKMRDCEPSACNESKFDRLQKIKMYLDAAKAKVEVCHNPQEGMELYNMALKMLQKKECKSCK
jgi:hypothetical protein